MSAMFSPAAIQAQRSKANSIPHQNLLYTSSNKDGAAFGCGDVGILHNIAILLQMKAGEKTFQHIIDRFHITVRTMRRSTEWDWVKPTHINLILSLLHEIHKDVDEFVEMFKQGQQFYLEQMEKSVEEGIMTEGDYLDLVNGLKKPYEFITSAEFKEWVKGRSEFYLTLKGEMPKVKLTYLAQFNKHDGKTLLITA